MEETRNIFGDCQGSGVMGDDFCYCCNGEGYTVPLTKEIN